MPESPNEVRGDLDVRRLAGLRPVLLPAGPGCALPMPGKGPPGLRCSRIVAKDSRKISESLRIPAKFACCRALGASPMAPNPQASGRGQGSAADGGGSRAAEAVGHHSRQLTAGSAGKQHYLAGALPAQL
jgi:hypothetical protein